MEVFFWCSTLAVFPPLCLVVASQSVFLDGWQEIPHLTQTCSFDTFNLEDRQLIWNFFKGKKKGIWPSFTIYESFFCRKKYSFVGVLLVPKKCSATKWGGGFPPPPPITPTLPLSPDFLASILSIVPLISDLIKMIKHRLSIKRSLHLPFCPPQRWGLAPSPSVCGCV